jgi:polysaccharide export outer membrane protein
MALASHFEVQPQDVVFVGPAGIVLWNRFLSQLLPTVQTFYYGTISAREIRDNQ